MLKDYLPNVFPLYDDESDFKTWYEEHDDVLDELQSDVQRVQSQVQVAYATGNELDLIGEDYGLIGQRRGRDDESYRSFLMSLVSAFNGTGTKPDVKLAVSSGLLIDKDDVEIIEPSGTNTYEIRIYDWTPHNSGVVHELANLADPISVPLIHPTHYILETLESEAKWGDTLTRVSTTYLETLLIEADWQDAQSKTKSQEGLSASELDPLSSDGWLLSAGDLGTWNTGTWVAELVWEDTESGITTVSEIAVTEMDWAYTQTETQSTKGLSSSTMAPLSTGSRWNLSEA